MRIVLKILGAIGAIILGVVVVAALQYPEFRIERSRAIPAPPEKIFPLIGDLHKWREWSPWIEMDPSVKNTFSGPEQGVGSKQEWSGDKTGSGSTTITAVEAPHRVKFDLHFVDMKAQNTGEFVLTPSGESTLVTWVMEGRNNLLGRIFFTAFGRSMVEKSFDRGLELLEKAVTVPGDGAGAPASSMVPTETPTPEPSEAH